MAQLVMTNPQEAYRKQKILTASPADLVVMLFDGLKKNIVLAGRAIEKEKTQKAHEYLLRSQEIITELINSLDMSYEISADLLDLYEFILVSLAEINVNKKTELIEPVLEIVSDLRDTWYVAAEAQKTGTALEEGLG